MHTTFARLIAALAVFSTHCASAPVDEPGTSETRDQSSTEGAGLFPEVRAILERSCAKQTCHGDLTMNAFLTFMTSDIRAQLVDVLACEYDRMPRVSPFQPDQSWLMVKLAGPQRFVQYADFIDFKPDPDWRPATPECTDRLPDGSPWFGTRMPPPDTTEQLSTEEIDLVREWIAAGASSG